MKKIIGFIASIALVLSMVGGSAAQAAALTPAQVSAIIGLLQSFGADATTVANVTASLNGQSTSGSVITTTSGSATSDFTFARDLTIGSKGADVTALQNFLISGGYMASGYPFGYFGSVTKAAVIKFQLKKSITPAAGYFGPKTRAIVSGSYTTTTTTTSTGTFIPTGTNLIVSLAATSPSTGAIVKGQSIADLAEYTLTNTSASPAIITNVTLQRGGISNDSALSNVYLYNGVQRITDAASVSQGKITFNAPAGLFTIPAGSSMTFAVRADISVSTEIGQIVILSLTNIGSSVTPSVTYPVSGAAQTISYVALSGVTVASSSVSASSIDPQTDYTMWYGSISVATNDAWLKAISLRQIGTVSAGDLGNFRLLVDGLPVGSALSSYDINGYLTYDLSALPVKLTTGTHPVKLIGDIIGGSTKTFSFSLRQASDINIVDSQVNVNVLATGANSATFPFTTGDQKINSGSLTITKSPTSPSGNVTLSSTGVALADFQIKASGEPVKIDNITVYVDGLAGTTTLRNGALFANGSQIGSNASIGSSTNRTTFNNLSLTVYPGSPVTLEVRADIAANSGTAIANGNTILISLGAGSANATLVKSLLNYNTTAVTGSQLTVAQGTLSLTKATGYSNQTTVVPQTGKLIGSYILTAGTTENLNLNTITVNLAGTSASTSDNVITDMFVTFGDRISSNKSTVSTTSDNSYSVNYVLPAGQQQTINVYATLASSIGAADVVSTKIAINGQTANSLQSVSVPATSGQYIQGQTIAVTTGTLNLALYNQQTDKIVVGGSQTAVNTVKAASYKFVASGDSFIIDQLYGSTSATTTVAGIVYKINGLTVGSASIDGVTGIATTTGLSITVPANSSAGVVVDAYVQLNQIVTPNGATSSSNVQFALLGYRQMTSNGVQTVATTTLAGNNQYAYASVPTITPVTLPSSQMSDGDQVIARVNIAADANGAIDWSLISFNVTKPTASVQLGVDATTWAVREPGGTAIAGIISTTTGNLATAATGLGVVTFTPNVIQSIGAGSSKTYELWTRITGSAAGSITTSIAKGATAHASSTASTTAITAAGTATFVWSDDSVVNPIHSGTTADWNNDFLVKNIPTNSQSLTY